MASQNGRFFSYRNTASQIIKEYNGGVPFIQYLKTYFRKFPKYGSRDRRLIADLCYGYFRIGCSVQQLDLSDQINIGFFLTHQTDNGYLEAVTPEWIEVLGSSIQNKSEYIASLFPFFNSSLIFPFNASLSSGIDKTSLSLSFLQKPSFFIRVRPGCETVVLQKLGKVSVSFLQEDSSCLKIFNHTDLDSIVDLNKDCVVQDISSQKTASLFPDFKQQPIDMWDACAASGGKSIMFHDYFPHAKIHVSDVRESILTELKKRFTSAGIHAASIFQVDFTSATSSNIIKKSIPATGLDFIIADVPCSGSGTWKRDPEWLRKFKEADLEQFQKKQIDIVEKIVPYLKTGGYLMYITCSVFKIENEDVLVAIEKKLGLKKVSASLISGSESGGDSLFAALLTLKS